MGPDGTEIDLRLDDEGDNWITVKGNDDATVEANAQLVGAAPSLQALLDEAVELMRDAPLRVRGRESYAWVSMHDAWLKKVEENRG